MKKLILLVCLFVGIGMSANVMAVDYSTGAAPFPGATHTYKVSTPIGGNTYSWNIYKKGALTADVSANTTYITSFTPSASPSDKVVIKWASSVTANDEFLLVVTETNGSCINAKAFPIKISASTFDLTVTGTNTCYKNAVAIAWTGGQLATDVVYTHGIAEVKWGIAVAGIAGTETCKFKVNFPTVTGITFGTPVVKQGGTVLSPSSDVYTATGTTAITVEVTATNGNSYNNSSAADAQNLTLSMQITDVISGTGAIEKSTGGGANEATLAVTRPNTTQIEAD